MIFIIADLKSIAKRWCWKDAAEFGQARDVVERPNALFFTYNCLSFMQRYLD
jgi:hypothetical protein